MKGTRRNRYPLPRNDAELEVVTLAHFGVALHLSTLSVWQDTGNFKVAESYDSYHGEGFQFSRGDPCGYNDSGNFWRMIFGRIDCGGIGRASHGQFKIVGHRQRKRLEHWQNSRRKGGVDQLRPPFVRLARRVGAGGNMAIRGSRVLTDGREDGASGALIRDGQAKEE